MTGEIKHFLLRGFDSFFPSFTARTRICLGMQNIQIIFNVYTIYERYCIYMKKTRYNLNIPLHCASYYLNLIVLMKF